MGKNIIICCDGTNNQFDPDRNSNIVKIYSVMNRSDQQVLYYDTGVGTAGRYSGFTRMKRLVKKILGLAFGYGIKKDILEAYSFLMENYIEGDKVFIYGFSRGAFTARALAGLVYKCGLLYPKNQNLIAEVFRIYRAHGNQKISNQFRTLFSRPSFDIHFLGLFDTVTSVGWIYDPVRFDNTTKNPEVTIIRHAIALDERRAFFRSNRWYAHDKNPKQDIKQVWFSGVHSDIGGGYPQNESSLSNIALEWMLVESCLKGLDINQSKAGKLVSDPPATPRVDAHNSLQWFWLPAEIWPKLKNIRFRSQWITIPWLNLAARRKINCDELVHESVNERIECYKNYSPPNLSNRRCVCDGECKYNELRIESCSSLSSQLKAKL